MISSAVPAKMPSEARNGVACRSLASERQSHTNSPKVMSGTGHSHNSCDPPNQRSRTCGCNSGVHTLTIATNTATADWSKFPFIACTIA